MLGLPIVFFLVSGLFVGLYAVSEYWSQRRLPTSRGLLGLVLLPIGATGAMCCFPLTIPVIVNQVRLERFAQGLYDYPLPRDTYVVSRHAEVGLMGNGNHCDFVAEQSMRPALSEAELEAHYEDVVLPEAMPPGSGAFVSVYFEGLAENPQLNKVRVRIFDIGNPAGFDFRCH